MSRTHATTAADPAHHNHQDEAPGSDRHINNDGGNGPTGPAGLISEVFRRASVSIMNTNPQLGVWQATGTAIAQAPNLAELRGSESGGAHIEFNSQGHSARVVAEEHDGELVLVRSNTNLSARRGSLVRGISGRSAGAAAAGMTRRDTGAALQDVHEDGDLCEEPSTSRPPSLSGAARADLKSGMGTAEDGSGKKGHRHDHRFGGLKRRQTLKDKHKHERLEKWGPTIKNGLLAFWKFFTTFAGFCITIYCLNIVAWGAMLFFLLLNAAPAMAVPTADDDYSPRKIWLEIDSQILNALFCVTGFGLAPWRFRDLYFFVRAAQFKDVDAMRRLAQQNKGWFRPPLWAVEGDSHAGSSANGNSTTTTTATATKYTNVPTADQDAYHSDIELGRNTAAGRRRDDGDGEESLDFEPRLAVRSMTFTGQTAPPTALWKLLFTIMMMVLNTAIQCVLCYFMWHYNRFDRPSWATGTFIALGCATGMFSGLMSWWEGRKVKKIEGPEVQIVEKVEV